jgi:RAB protein geranylgeranyltransferase component A
MLTNLKRFPCSLYARALSKAGFKVAHVDTNPFYGADQASLSADELIRWAKQRTDTENRSTYLSLQRVKFTSVSCSSSSLSEARQYSLSLSPSIIPSRGPLISALVSSGVSRYGGFRLLERVGIYDCFGSVKPVPWSKDDIFKSKSISLIDKRRLMRFLMFAAGEFEGSKELVGKENSSFREFLKTNFSLTEEIAAAVAYSLAYCSTSTGLLDSDSFSYMLITCISQIPPYRLSSALVDISARPAAMASHHSS